MQTFRRAAEIAAPVAIVVCCLGPFLGRRLISEGARLRLRRGRAPGAPPRRAQGLDDEVDVLVQVVTPKFLGPLADLLAVDGAGEAPVLELLPDAAHAQVGEALRGPHQGAGHEESRTASSRSSTANRARATGVSRGTPL